MMIHPTAIIEDGATLGAGVSVGPYSIIGAQVTLGDGVEIGGHVVIAGKTRIGARTKIYPFAAIGHGPQHTAYKGEDVSLVIGENCTIREHVTMHAGTPGGGGVTSVGNNGLFLVGSHVAHDCHVGNNVIMINNATLGGHVEVGDFAYLGGLSAVHQFVRLGQHCIIGGMTGVENDVIPYGSATGDRAVLVGLNIVGLKRRGFARETVHTLRTAYRLLFADEGTLSERVGDVEELFKDVPEVMDIVTFIRGDGQRSICTPHRNRG